MLADIDANSLDGSVQRTNISSSRKLLQGGDACARNHGAPRSWLLAEAARRAMREKKGESFVAMIA